MPLGTFIEEYEKAEKLREVFKVTLNDKIPETYDIDIRENQVYILLQEEAAATREDECVVKVAVNNGDLDVYLCTSNNGHGIPVCIETFTWTIERPVVTTTVYSNEVTEVKQELVTSSVMMKPIIKKCGYSYDEATITPALVEVTAECVYEPVIPPPIHTEISFENQPDEATITPSLVKVTAECIQIGIKPV